MPQTAGPDARVGSAVRASARWMELNRGTYCISHEAGSTVPDPATGLPAARLSTLPGAAVGSVAIAGLAGDGWVGPPGSAMLVQVLDQSVRLLMTIYQDEGAAGPKLRVARLGEAAVPMTGATSTAEIVALAQDGSELSAGLGEWIGYRGSRRALLGFTVTPAQQGLAAADIEYQAVLGPGWLTPWTPGGQLCGSPSARTPILGLHVRLCGDVAGRQRLGVAASFTDGSEVGQATPDTPCQADSLAPLEAFCITLLPADG